MSSLFELQTQLEIVYRLKYVKEDSHNNIFEQSKEIERMLSSLIKKVKK